MTKAREPDIKIHAYAATILRWPDTPEWLTGCCRNERPDTSECALIAIVPHAYLTATFWAIVNAQKQGKIDDLLTWNYAVKV